MINDDERWPQNISLRRFTFKTYHRKQQKHTVNTNRHIDNIIRKKALTKPCQTKQTTELYTEN